jgi:GMP synthase (glutamine-hydrolysing)
MRILIIDNNIDQDCWGSSDLCRMVRIASNASIYVRRAPHEDLPASPAGFDRIIVSGSKTSALDDAPWINQLIEFIKKTVANRIPYLGVCYGHQALARALGSKHNVRKASSPEYGWTHIQTLEPSVLLKGIPSSFYSFSAHYDEVCLLPAGMKRLAFSEACKIQACQLENFPIFGIQFHPEKSIDEAKKLLSDRKKKGDPPNLLHPNQSDELFDPKVGETIFKNFLEIESL